MFDRGIPLSALLGAGSSALDRRGIPEAQVARLRESFARFEQPSPFKPGDLVTPRPDATVSGAGDPHIVLEVIVPTTPSFRSDAFCSEKRLDMRTAYVSRTGDIHTHWAESWEWEAWSPPPASVAEAPPRPVVPGEARTEAAA